MKDRKEIDSIKTSITDSFNASMNKKNSFTYKTNGFLIQLSAPDIGFLITAIEMADINPRSFYKNISFKLLSELLDITAEFIYDIQQK